MPLFPRTRVASVAIAWAIACGGTHRSEPAVGAASISAAIDPLAAADIDHVTLTISGGALAAPLVQTLQKVDATHYTGTVADIPAAAGYLFVAEGWGAGTPAPVLYRGEQADVTISPGQVAQVLVVMQEVDPSGPPTSTVPVIDGMSASSTAVTSGAVVHLSVTAHSPDGHALTYAWQASCGTFSTPSQPATDWTAPVAGGTCQVSVQVTDPVNATSVTAYLPIVVNATGGSGVQITVNTHPVVTTSLAEYVVTSSPPPNGLTVGITADVVAIASDPDRDPLSYAWSSSCGGAFSSPAAPSVRFHTDDPAAPCTLTVAVSDGRGGTTTVAVQLSSQPCIAGQGCTPADPCGLAGVTACGAAGAPATCSATVLAADGTACTGPDGAGSCAQGRCVAFVPFAEGRVTIEFDDGKASQLLALPTLQQYGFHASFFVITSFVGGPGYLTLDDLRSLAAGGHEIASHTVDHPYLSTLSDAEIRSELADSRSWLVTNVAPDAAQTFASPYGDYDARVVATARELYRAHQAGGTRFDWANTDPGLLGGIAAVGTVAQIEAFIDRAVAERSWLVLAFHDLTTEPTNQFVDNVDDFAAILAYLSSRQVRVVTVVEGLADLVAAPPPAAP